MAGSPTKTSPITRACPTRWPISTPCIPPRFTLFRRAFDRLEGDLAGFSAFRHASKDWLDDFSLFMTIKEAHGGRAWNDWDHALTTRQPEALEAFRKSHAREIRFVEFVQYLFHTQWERLRTLCRLHKIGIIGDLPIFVSGDSADVWARPDLFQLDEHGKATAVAGVPPDYFSETGQLWGNPVYKWPAHMKENFAWWISRFKASSDRADLVRLDHFRGFEAYWEVPADAPTAAYGKWVPSPGASFLEALQDALGNLPLIAEDLGKITPEVELLRDAFHLPGMRILQFAFGDDPNADNYLPYKHIHHTVVYTGTHDNDTTVGWFSIPKTDTTQPAALIAAERAFVLRFVGTDGAKIHWDLIRVAHSSVADTSIIPMQDILGLDSSARMNTPGKAVGNWGWRFTPDQFDQYARDHLADVTAVYDRWNGPVPAKWKSPRRTLTDATS